MWWRNQILWQECLVETLYGKAKSFWWVSDKRRWLTGRMINLVLYINLRKFLVKEATIYKCQVGDTMNAQINQTRLCPINHISWNGIKKSFTLQLFNALLMNFMYFCEVAKLSTWQMFSRDEKPQGGVISLACWWLQETIA